MKSAMYALFGFVILLAGCSDSSDRRSATILLPTPVEPAITFSSEQGRRLGEPGVRLWLCLFPGQLLRHDA